MDIFEKIKKIWHLHTVIASLFIKILSSREEEVMAVNFTPKTKGESDFGKF